MKTIFFLILICIGTNSNAHIMDQAIQSLAKARSDFSEIAKQNPEDRLLQSQINQLNGKLADLWSDAILLPLLKGDTALAQLGYSIVPSKDSYNSYELKEDRKPTILETDEDNFVTDNWKHFRDVTRQQIQDLKEIDKMVSSPQYSGGFSRQEIKRVDFLVQSNRRELLREMDQLASNKVDCIDYLNSVARSSGLKLVIVGDRASWDPEQIHRTYGVMSTENLSSSQKTQVATQIDEIISQTRKLRMACTPRSVREFLRQERKQLAGDKK